MSVIKSFLFLLIILVDQTAQAGLITGVVKDSKGALLPFSSILIKGTTQGTTANSKGVYSFQAAPGQYQIVCQHVGYTSVEKTVRITKGETVLDFVLEEQRYNLKEVIVKSGSEDPAYEIIRNAIKNREQHLSEIRKFQCRVYIKGQLQLRDYPKRFMGDKVDFEDGDTSKRKMIFLSETVAKYFVEDSKRKVEVISTRVSGRSDGYGFSNPQVISFYENNIQIGRGLNPRGFISPIANNALQFYKYKFEGTFYENGVEISRVKVIPRRKYEPLFSGYINITEGEWRIQGVQLKLLREQQMQFLDTLTIEQLYVPLKNVWIIKQQVLYPSGKFFGFDFFGSFVQVYDQFDIDPVFNRKFFGNTLLKFTDSSNKKNRDYWDSVRPVPLLDNEIRDYHKKDSLEQLHKDPHYMDSLDRVRNKVTLSKLLLTGQSFEKERKQQHLAFDPLLDLVGIYYNPAEGRLLDYGIRYTKEWKGEKRLQINPEIRYGFANRHLNEWVNSNYRFGKKNTQTISAEGGKKVFQFSNQDPISELNNTLSTYFWQHNEMKTYEAAFVKLAYSSAVGDGLTVFVNLQFQDRKPLDNTILGLDGRLFSPNYPTAILSSNLTPDKSAIAMLGLNWRPGTKYIEFPDSKINIGSRYPVFNLSLTRGFSGLLGSSTDYMQWHFNVSDNINMHIIGRLNLKAEMGGFLYANRLYAPDYQHYLGDQTVIAGQYLNGFQLMPYYMYSNTASFYTAGHVEYHLNGLFTNKIPGFRKLNWFLVLGANGLYINNEQHYYELFFSVENIFKVARIDFVKGYEQNSSGIEGIRVAVPLLLNRGRRSN